MLVSVASAINRRLVAEGTTTQPQSLEASLTQGAERAVGGAFQGAVAADVTRAIASGQKAAQALRAARALTNADEPAAVFAAIPKARVRS